MVESPALKDLLVDAHGLQAAERRLPQEHLGGAAAVNYLLVTRKCEFVVYN